MLMSRKEFIDALQKTSEEITDCKWSKVDCETLIDIFAKTVQDCLAEGKEPNIIGFGKFIIKIRNKTKCMNPATKEIMDVPEIKMPVFKASSILKDAVRGGKKNECDENVCKNDKGAL